MPVGSTKLRSTFRVVQYSQRFSLSGPIERRPRGFPATKKCAALFQCTFTSEERQFGHPHRAASFQPSDRYSKGLELLHPMRMYLTALLCSLCHDTGMSSCRASPRTLQWVSAAGRVFRAVSKARCSNSGLITTATQGSLLGLCGVILLCERSLVNRRGRSSARTPRHSCRTSEPALLLSVL